MLWERYRLCALWIVWPAMFLLQCFGSLHYQLLIIQRSLSLSHSQELRKTLRTQGSENGAYYNFMNIGRRYEIPGFRDKRILLFMTVRVTWASFLCWLPLPPQRATHRVSVRADATHIVGLHHSWEVLECRESESLLMRCMETYLTFFS